MSSPCPAATEPAPQRGQLWRYAAIGGVATAVHMAVLGVLVEVFAVPPGLGSVAGAVVGAQVAFFGNRRFTFGHVGPLWSAWWRFQVTALAGGALGACLVAGATGLGLHWLPAQAMATGTVLLVTFVANRRWSFREDRR